MPVVSMSDGLGEDQSPLAAREQPGEDPHELRGGVLEGLGEHLLDALVHFLDDVQQVLAAGFEVLELGAEELVAFLQRGEFLQRQGLTRPRADRSRSARLRRFSCSSRTKGFPATISRPSSSTGARRAAHLSADSRRARGRAGQGRSPTMLRGEAQLLDAPELQGLDPQALLGVVHFVR